MVILDQKYNLNLMIKSLYHYPIALSNAYNLTKGNTLK